MIIVRDFRGCAYKIIEVNLISTLLEEIKTGARIRIRSYGWDEIGFVKP